MRSEKLKIMAKLAKERLINKDCQKEMQEEMDSAEKALYSKIVSILKTNPDTPAPIKELIDHSKFDSFSPLQKEIYIFDLIEKYNAYKARYEKTCVNEIAV